MTVCPKSTSKVETVEVKAGKIFKEIGYRQGLSGKTQIS